jgi:DNA-binding NtrC family response regulator
MTDVGNGAPPERAMPQLLLPKYSAPLKLVALPKPSPPAPARTAPHQMLDLLDRVAARDTEVLITGPAGAGKVRYAQYLHQRSDGADRAFVPVSCAEVPQDWIESELFGHGGGACNGAQPRSGGLIAEADGGTLFLDGGDLLPLGVQVKLLRFLQEKEYRPLGGNRLEHANMRIIAATNGDPTGAEVEKRFLQEFLCGLRMTVVEVPALAGRDIPFLLAVFASAYAETYCLPRLAFSGGALEKLSAYSWPGDLRELENWVKYLTCLQLARPVDACDLPLLADDEPEHPLEINMLAETGKLKPVNLDLMRLFERVDPEPPPGRSNGAFTGVKRSGKALRACS